MKPILWNLFLVGVLLISLSIGSTKLSEPLSMADLADYSPVMDLSGNPFAKKIPSSTIAPFSWPESSMTPAPTTAATTGPSWVEMAKSTSSPATTVSAPTTSPLPTMGVPSSSPLPTMGAPSSSPLPTMGIPSSSPIPTMSVPSSSPAPKM